MLSLQYRPSGPDLDDDEALARPEYPVAAKKAFRLYFAAKKA
jgi:hypothetical protein